jgi:glycine cleavage system H protein
MIPVVLPLAIFVLAFAALLGLAMLALAGTRSVYELSRASFSPSSEESEIHDWADVPEIVPVLNKTMPRIEGYALPQALFYHRGHTWVVPNDSGTAVVGIDEFLSKLLGAPTRVEAPAVGQILKRGQKAWTVHRGNKCLDIASPLEGEVIAVNRRVAENPQTLSVDPYGEGWLILVKPQSFSRDLRNLLQGSAAVQWMEESAAALRTFFSGKVGLVFQDGGLPVDGLADLLGPDEWNRLIRHLSECELKTSGN